MLQDRTDDEAVKLRRLLTRATSANRAKPEHINGSAQNVAASGRHTFARNDLLFTMSDNTRDTFAPWKEQTAARNFLFHGRVLESVRRARRWWSQTGSNRRPPACKAGALPTELWPRSNGTQQRRELVGLGRFELPTSRLSSARSNQLSYRPRAHAQPALPERARA